MKTYNQQLGVGIVAALLTIALTGRAQADLVAYEPFNTGSGAYDTAELGGQNPSSLGFTGAWSGDTSLSVSEAGLSHPDVVSSGGSVVRPAVVNARVTRQLATAYTASSEETIWISLLF